MGSWVGPQFEVTRVNSYSLGDIWWEECGFNLFGHQQITSELIQMQTWHWQSIDLCSGARTTSLMQTAISDRLETHQLMVVMPWLQAIGDQWWTMVKILNHPIGWFWGWFFSSALPNPKHHWGSLSGGAALARPFRWLLGSRASHCSEAGFNTGHTVHIPHVSKKSFRVQIKGKSMIEWSQFTPSNKQW